MKICSVCGKEKGFDQFAPLKKRRYGSYHSADCLECRRNKERMYNMRSYWKNRDIRLDRMRTYRDRDPEAKRERDRLYYRANAEQIKARVKVYREQHLEEEALRHRDWMARNPVRMKSLKDAGAARRNARIKAQWVEPVDLRAVWERDSGVCQLCLQPVSFEEMSPDHIVPISRGGAHATWNVQTSHRSCNLKRKAKPMEQVILERNRLH